MANTWTRYRRIIKAAAAIVLASGGTVGAALVIADAADPEPMTCAQVRRAALSKQRRRPVFYQRPAGVPVPDAFNVAGTDYTLGDCDETAPKHCLLKRDDCGAKSKIRFGFDVSGSHGGDEMVLAYAQPPMIKALKKYTEATAGYTWGGTFETVRGNCAGSGPTPLQCWRMINDLNDCWLLAADPGYICRHTDNTRNGFRYGAGAGGTAACQPVVGDLPYPCQDFGIKAGAHETTEDLPPDNELDWPVDE